MSHLRFLALPTLFTVVVLIGLLALGTWQVQRLAWKQDLIARVAERPGLPPVPAPGPSAWPNFDFDRFEYLPVTVTGTFGEREAHVYAVLTEPNGRLGGQGYWVMAPFTSREGWTVVVNRGFIPHERKAAESRPDAAVSAAPATVTGLIRRPGTSNRFTPKSDPERNYWFTRDPADFVDYFGLEGPVAPYSIDLVAAMTPPGGLPQAGETRMRFANNHLQYAVTWYGLALTLLGVYGVFVWTRLRPPKGR